MEPDVVTKAILSTVSRNPGVRASHVVDSARGLGLTGSGLRTRLRTLERDGLIRCERKFKKCFVYPAE